MSGWRNEQLFFEAGPFFDSLIRDIENAKKSITYECYIYEPGSLATRIESAMRSAQTRGVSVRLLVDSMGSPTTFSASIPFKRFNPWIKWLNRRNHRKICVIDNEIAYVGGMNVSDEHLEWRDTGVRLVGDPVTILSESFELTWNTRWNPIHHYRISRSSLIRLNHTIFERRRLYTDLLKRIHSAQGMIWITTAYFIPTRSLMRALKKAAKHGVDIRILVPGMSDVPFTKWISYAFYRALLDSKIRIFEYQHKILHAKSVIINEWTMVGSSNLNHRSLMSDLEVDVLLTKDSTKAELKKQFLIDLEHSIEINHELLQNKPWIEQFLGRLLLVVRAWI